MKKNLSIILTVIALLFCPKVNFGQGPNLGAASSFAMFTSVGAFTNTGPSHVTGDIGTNAGALSGFPSPGTVVGQIHVADATSAQAATDVGAAYSNLTGITCGVVLGTSLGNNQTLTPNVYCVGAAATLNGDLTLDGQGDPNALFIIKIDGALAAGSSSNVVLINSASIGNVYWQINGQFDLGDGSVFRGTLVVNGAINLLGSSSLQGRGLSLGGAITMSDNIVDISSPPIASTISAGGATTFCAGDSVILSGNSGGTWNTGATTSSISVTISGDYFVTNSNSIGSTTSNHIIVTVNPLPIAAIISANGATTFCAGDNVILSGNNGGTWSNGATTSSITVTTSGDYFVTNSNGCGSATSNHIIVTVSSQPIASTILAGGPTTFCAGGNVILSGNNGGTWSTSETTSSITVTASGDYSVTNSNGCGSVTSNHIIVTVSSPPIASTISANGATTFCAGGNVILSGNNGGIWNTSATTSSITITTSGDYFVTNSNDCGSVTSNHIIVTVSSQPIASIISANGATTFCAGDSVILSGNSGGTWNTNATTSSITVNTSGDYSVTNSNGCGSITSNHIIVTVSSQPIASIISANGPTTFCAGDNVILSGNNGGTWSTSETTSFITVSTSGDYFVTNSNGCGSVTSNHIIVTISSPPIASTISANGSTTFCSGGNVILSGNNGGTWSTSASTSSITVTTSGDYFVTNSNGCGSVTSNHIIITVSSPPIASTISAGGPTTFCSGDSVILSGNSGGTWNNSATTSSITVTTSGDYLVTNSNGCGSVTSNHIIVTVSSQPIASTISAGGATTFCAGDNVILSGNNGGTWSTSETTSSITVTTSGDYFVNNSNGCGSVTSNHIIVTVSSQPIASTISAGGTTTFCAGGNVILSGNNGGTWSNGATTPSITVTTSGDYSVTNSNGCGSVTSNHIIVTVSSQPIASTISAGGPTTFCSGDSVILSGNSGGTWSTSETTSSITVTTSGDYFVTNSNGCGSVTSNHIIVTVNPLPIASTISANGATTFCSGGNVILSGNNGGTWSTSETTSSITVTTSGDYFVTNSNGCGSVTSNHIIVTISSQPIASTISANGSTTFCSGGNVILSGNNGGIWSNGATTSSITVTTSGDYFVTNSNGCGSVTSNHIIANSQSLTSTILANGPTTFCAGDSVRLDAGVYISYIWNTGATTEFIEVFSSQSYCVTVIALNGCTATACLPITVNPTPVPVIYGVNTICQGGSTILSTGSYASYAWSSGETTQSIIASSPITHNVTVTDANGCTGAIVPGSCVAIVVSNISIPTISSTSPTCQGGSVTLSSNSYSTYLWSNGATSQSIAVSATGIYYLTVTNSSGCSAVAHRTVTSLASQNPVIFASGPTNFCPGGFVNLNVIGSYVAYLWSTGATTQGIHVTATGNYQVTVTYSIGCTGTASVATNANTNVSVNPVITYTNPAPCAVSSVVLSTGVFSSYHWNTGVAGPQISIPANGTYSVTVTNASGCSGVASVTTAFRFKPSATITSTTGLTVCSGSVSMDAGAGFVSYLWSNGSNSEVISVSASGIYNVTVTNSVGCTATALANVSIGGTANIIVTCANGSAKLTSSNNATYLWSNGATTKSITVNTPNTYCLTVTYPHGCTASSCYVLNSICPVPTGLATTNIAATSAMVNWIPSSCVHAYTIAFSPHNCNCWVYYTIAPNSHYTFSGLLRNTCYNWKIQADCSPDNTSIVSGYSAIQTFCTLARLEAGEFDNTTNAFQVYPNPTEGMTTVEFSSFDEGNYNLRLVDLSGRTLLDEGHEAVAGINQVQLNLGTYAKGLYFLILDKGDYKLQSRIVVQ